MTVTPISTAQHCIPRSLNPETPSDVYVSMEEKDEGRRNPELTDFGLEKPGQQCPPNEGIWETGRTIADGYLLAGMGSNQGGDISSPQGGCVGTRAGSATTPANSSNATFRQQGHKPKDKDKGSDKNKQFDPGRKGKKPPPWNAAVILYFFFLGGALGHGKLVIFSLCSLSLCACLSVFYLLFLSGDHFSAS